MCPNKIHLSLRRPPFLSSFQLVYVRPEERLFKQLFQEQISQEFILSRDLLVKLLGMNTKD